MTWRDMAACADVDPEVFFPHAGNPRGYATKASKGRALTVCAECRVTVACLDAALATPLSQDFGIWGGTTAGQRVVLRVRLRQHQPLPSETFRSRQETASISL